MSKPKLALIPSGYKSGKVYSILPNDATGDFDFDRASIGTRVRKDGLIEEAKTVGSITNLQIRSEEFDDSVWTKTRTTITADQELAPNGTNTADKLTGDGTGTSYVYDALNFTASQKYTISIYVKPINVTTFSIQKFSGGFGIASFDLSTGTISSAPTGPMSNPIIESLSNGWFRCSVEHIPTATGSQNYGFGLQDYSGDQFYIWGAMVSEGALSDYIKTEGTTETKTVETFTDVPRLDWLNSNCPSLLLEPQRTNLQVYSEEFDNAAWGKSNLTIEANSIISPNGELTADKLIGNTVTGNHYVQYVASGLSTSSEATLSVFVKKDEITQIELLSAQSTPPYTNWGRLRFDLETLTTFQTPIGTFNYEDYGNGWLRLFITGTPTSTSAIIRFTLYKNNTSSWAGNDSDGFYLFGAQVEQGDYPTSYIKTEASTVTRLKDECLNGGDSDLFNITEGTFFVDVTPYKASSYKISLSDGTDANRIIFIFISGSNQIRFFSSSNFTGSTVTYLDATPTTLTYNSRNKIALTFKTDEFKCYANGSLVHTDTSGYIPQTLSELNFSNRAQNNEFFEGKVYDTRVYDRVLTEAEAIELTTL